MCPYAFVMNPSSLCFLMSIFEVSIGFLNFIFFLNLQACLNVVMTSFRTCILPTQLGFFSCLVRYVCSLIIPLPISLIDILLVLVQYCDLAAQFSVVLIQQHFVFLPGMSNLSHLFSLQTFASSVFSCPYLAAFAFPHFVFLPSMRVIYTIPKLATNPKKKKKKLLAKPRTKRKTATSK